MRTAARAAVGAAAALAALGGGPAVGLSAEPAARRAAARAHLQVTQIEYRLLLSRGSVRAGTLNLEEIDGGMDPHDLRLRRAGSGSTIYGRLLLPGRRWDGVVHLTPGVYTLWCALPEHQKLGMHATLRVTR